MESKSLKICFLVLAHTSTRHYARLIKILTGGGDYVVTHIDTKSDQGAFEAAAPPTETVHYLHKRTDIKWGTWSIMGATMDLLEKARAIHPDASYYWVLSGDMYPIASMIDIHKFLDQKCGTEFVNYVQMPSQDKPIQRISHRRLDYDARTDKHPILHQIALRLMRRPYKRKLGGRTPFGGSNWVTLSSSAVDFLINTFYSDTALVALARTSSHPDEFFVQTVLCNSAFKESIEPALFCADFRGTTPHAAVLDYERLAYLKSKSEELGRPRLMARKFNDESEKLLDEIESEWE